MNINTSDPNIKRERNEYPIRNVAVIGLLNPIGQVLLVRTTRLPDHWQPLGGGMEPCDKDPVDAVIRELSEETSIRLQSADCNLEIITDYDFGSGKVFFFSALISPDRPIRFNKREVVEHKWFFLQDTLKLNVFPATKIFLKHLINDHSSC